MALSLLPPLQLAPWSPSLPTAPSYLDNVAVPPVWDGSTNQTDPSSRPGPHVALPTTTNALDAGQSAPATGPIPPHSSHTSSFGTSYSNTDFAITLVKPRPTQGGAIVLPRIETHVYLDISFPSQSWNAIQLPRTKSVTSDDSFRTGEGMIPLLLFIIVRGATTRQECNSVCEQCKKRMGNMIGSSDLIDFHAASNILTPKDGMVQVHFTFSCYSRHHRKVDAQYVYVAVT